MAETAERVVSIDIPSSTLVRCPKSGMYHVMDGSCLNFYDGSDFMKGCKYFAGIEFDTGNGGCTPVSIDVSALKVICSYKKLDYIVSLFREMYSNLKKVMTNVGTENRPSHGTELEESVNYLSGTIEKFRESMNR